MGNKAREGSYAEQLAKWRLRLSGYKIIEMNYRTRIGEIDIIARQGGELVFVEVKSRRSGNAGSPEEAVTDRKVDTISKVALTYLTEKGLNDVPARFDVVAVDLSRKRPRIRVIKDAFESTV